MISFILLLIQTITALLDFSKLEARAVKLSIIPLSSADLIIDCQELLIALASDKGLELTYYVESDVPTYIEADGPRIRQGILFALQKPHCVS